MVDCPQKELLQMKGDNQSQIRQKEKEVEEVKQALGSLQVNTHKYITARNSLLHTFLGHHVIVAQKNTMSSSLCMILESCLCQNCAVFSIHSSF